MNPVALFGLGCTSLGAFTDDYRLWFKRRNKRRKNKAELPIMAYVPSFKATVKDADIYLMETVATFVSMRDKIPFDSAVVVSDSPLLLSELPGVKPLDWMKDAWKFRLNPVDFSQFETQRMAAFNAPEEIWVDATPTSLDRLGLIIDETASGTLLTPINSVMFQLNFMDRVIFRQALAKYLAGTMDLGTFDTNMTNMITQSQADTAISLKALKQVVTMLKTQGPMYQRACGAMLEKKSPNKHIKDANVTPFEIRYLTRLITSNTPKAKEEAA